MTTRFRKTTLDIRAIDALRSNCSHVYVGLKKTPEYTELGRDMLATVGFSPTRRKL